MLQFLRILIAVEITLVVSHISLKPICNANTKKHEIQIKYFSRQKSFSSNGNIVAFKICNDSKHHTIIRWYVDIRIVFLYFCSCEVKVCKGLVYCFGQKIYVSLPFDCVLYFELEMSKTIPFQWNQNMWLCILWYDFPCFVKLLMTHALGPLCWLIWTIVNPDLHESNREWYRNILFPNPAHGLYNFLYLI